MNMRVMVEHMRRGDPNFNPPADIDYVLVDAPDLFPLARAHGHVRGWLRWHDRRPSKYQSILFRYDRHDRYKWVIEPGELELPTPATVLSWVLTGQVPAEFAKWHKTVTVSMSGSQSFHEVLGDRPYLTSAR